MPMNDIVLPNDSFSCNDKVVQQLLKKLDQGTETIINLRSLLTCKTAELNEILHELELIDQVLTNVENGTEQIETVLKEVVSSTGQQDNKLLDAEATLDSAIQSAYRLYSIEDEYSLTEKEILLEKIRCILMDLNHSASIHAYEKDDIKVLQKAFVDLDLARTVANNVQNQFKHRSKLLKHKHYPINKVKQLAEEMKRQAVLYKSYTRNQPLLINGKDIITILDHEDQTYRTIATSLGAKQRSNHLTATTNKKRQPSLVNKPIHSNPSITLHKNKSSPVNNQPKSTLEMIARPTLTSMAKSKEKKTLANSTTNGPGSTLRLRNMLSKRNPLKMINHQQQAIVV